MYLNMLFIIYIKAFYGGIKMYLCVLDLKEIKEKAAFSKPSDSEEIKS